MEHVGVCTDIGEGIIFVTKLSLTILIKDTLREECEADDDCLKNCCVSPYFAPLFFVVFVLMAQFVLVNVVVAVLMKHLEESHKQVWVGPRPEGLGDVSIPFRC